MAISVPNTSTLIQLPWRGLTGPNAGLLSLPSITSAGNEIASFADGFPVATMTSEAAGGTPPRGQDINGILNQVTTLLQYINAGGIWYFNATLAAAIGGFPIGCVVLLNDGQTLVQSTITANLQDPNISLTGWRYIQAGYATSAGNAATATLATTAVNATNAVNATTAANGVPPGTVISFAGPGTPSGYLFCNGGGYSTSSFPNLFSAIGYYWGGSGSTFYVPNMINNVAVGAGGNWGVGASGGEVTHTLQIGEMPSHNHQNPHAGSPSGNGAIIGGNSPSFDGTMNSSYTGGGAPHNNMQPFLSMYYFIKY